MKQLPLKGVLNARELGGYVMSDGRTIKSNLLIRSGALSHATDNDLNLLHNYGVIHIFDYRTQMEQENSPDMLVVGSDYISLPCINSANNLYEGTEYSKHAGREGFYEFLVDYSFSDEAQKISEMMYPNLVMSEFTQLQYGTFLNYASRNEEGALLWHCSQGKDRTGLASAFLLYILGAPKQIIIEDFDYSNIFYADLIQYLRDKVTLKGGKEKEIDVINSMVGVNTMRFCNLFDLIKIQFGSLDNYVYNQLCLTDEDIKNIRNRFLA